MIKDIESPRISKLQFTKEETGPPEEAITASSIQSKMQKKGQIHKKGKTIQRPNFRVSPEESNISDSFSPDSHMPDSSGNVSNPFATGSRHSIYDAYLEEPSTENTSPDPGIENSPDISNTPNISAESEHSNYDLFERFRDRPLPSKEKQTFSRRTDSKKDPLSTTKTASTNSSSKGKNSSFNNSSDKSHGRSESKLSFDESKKKGPTKLKHPSNVTQAINTEIHRTVRKVNEDENVAADASYHAEKSIETALHEGEHAFHAHKIRSARKAEINQGKENLRVTQMDHESDNPHFKSNPISRWQQKRAIRKEYAAAKAGKRSSYSTFNSTQKKAREAVAGTKNTIVKAVDSIRKKPKLLILALLGGMLFMVMGAVQSCTPLAQSVLESLVIGTYPATEEDVRAAERAYAKKEKDLKYEMDHYETVHPGYDEYNITQEEIWHNPYVLIAIISAYYDGQDWTIDSAMPVINKYFDLQYIVTENIVTETRYRTETVAGNKWVTDPDTGKSTLVPYSYETKIPYKYTICNVTLKNRDLSHMPVLSMSHHTMGMYALYMATHGNMEGIFSGNPHAVPLKDPYIYIIPEETLAANPQFAKLMEEANKYVGYPYVWGGASPETSFDCSGFVSYVYTASGVYNTGRLGAKGLRSLCRTVTEEELRPGDLVFFDGTMGEGVDGITHVGIYVGNHHMIHCGSPCGYADLNDHYWRQHFHSYGRVPY